MLEVTENEKIIDWTLLDGIKAKLQIIEKYLSEEWMKIDVSFVVPIVIYC